MKSKQSWDLQAMVNVPFMSSTLYPFLIHPWFTTDEKLSIYAENTSHSGVEGQTKTYCKNKYLQYT